MQYTKLRQEKSLYNFFDTRDTNAYNGLTPILNFQHTYIEQKKQSGQISLRTDLVVSSC